MHPGFVRCPRRQSRLGHVDLPIPPARELADALRSALTRRTRRTLQLPGRRAAVLLVIYDIRDEPHVVLTRRTDTLTTHRGQVSLPGGATDPEDADARATALRETHEELGIRPEYIRVLGELDDVHTAVSSFIVTPVVGHLDERPIATPNPAEIARVIEAPVREILSIDARLPPDAGVATLRYPLCGEDVWGATARMLRDFSEVTRAALRG